MENVEIKSMKMGDWHEVARIYADGIATKNATFETQVPDWEWISPLMEMVCLLTQNSQNGITASK